MGMPLCFYVLGAFLPSVPCRARDADLPRIKTPPDGAAQVARRQITNINLRFICNLAASGRAQRQPSATLQRPDSIPASHMALASKRNYTVSLENMHALRARCRCTPPLLHGSQTNCATCTGLTLFSLFRAQSNRRIEPLVCHCNAVHHQRDVDPSHVASRQPWSIAPLQAVP